MNFIETSEPSPSQKADILALWNGEYPAALALDMTGFRQYLEGLEDRHHFLLPDDKGIVRGWLFLFLREDDRWFAMVLDNSLQGKGVGSRLLSLAQGRHRVLNGWVIDHNGEPLANGQPYRSPLGFYRKLGFEVFEEELIVKKGIRGIRVRWEKH